MNDDCPIAETAAFLPRHATLQTLAASVQKCRGCPLYCHATQAVFGEGPKRARIVLVGEQPGDREDLAGKPFVGPAGRLLDGSLAAAGIDRTRVYVTNAVKHFKWQLRGTRRLHSRPSWKETMACKPWLMEELKLIEPALVICLGATAAQSLLGKAFRLTAHRREVIKAEDGTHVVTTVHPSSLLRIPDRTARQAARVEFVADLAFALKSSRQDSMR